MYVARDKDDDLYLYKKQPVKYSDSWQLCSDNPHDFYKLDSSLFPEVKWEDEEPTEVELVKKIKREPGHILFSFNRKTGEIKRASIIHKVAIGLNGLPVTKTETVIEPDCYYDQALNEKNFRKKLKRIGLLSI